MKKGKGVMTITIGLICFVLTYVIFIQFKTVDETNITEIETLTETELREKIVSWKEKYEETNEKLQETNEKIKEYKEKKEANQEASELLDKELLQAEIISGGTDIIGDGIIVTISNKNAREEIESHHLIYLLNELKNAGAEAISINDQRIINMSDIVDIYIDNGEDVAHCILINKEDKYASTYVVKAIGDQKYLESALTTKGVGFMELYEECSTLEKQNNIRIPKYSGEISLKYIDMKGEE